MKYGYLSFGRNPAQGRNQYGNLGDWYQSFAVQALFRKMGVPDSETQAIRRTGITDYRGEQTRLVLQGCFLHMKGAPVFPVSADLDPCFFGFHCLSALDRKGLLSLPDDLLIGCRDEPTFHRMQKLGKRAFLSGCLSMTLDKRPAAPENGKVFLVDAPRGIEDYMPAHLRERAEYISQSFRIENEWDESETHERLRRKAEETLAKYRDEAALVVTSRLHAASPCTALGIPVILARNYFDERYAWIEKFLPLYTPDRFGAIDWNVQAPDVEPVKRQILDAAAACVERAPEAAKRADELTAFWLDRERGAIRKPIYVKAYHFLQGTAPKTADFCREVLLQKFTVETSRNKE
jgi:hypothetical protein